MPLKKRWRALLIVGFCVGLLVLLVACAPTTNAGSSQKTDGEDSEIGTIVAIDWTPESECSVCHITEAASFTDKACLASKHPEVACISCHGDEEVLALAHQEKTTADPVPARLKVSTVTQETCKDASCHPQSSYQELAELTVGSTVLTDNRDNVVNPHEMPLSTPSHIKAEMQCTDCHAVHDPEGYEAAQDYCYSCHHHKVYECGTCHTIS